MELKLVTNTARSAVLELTESGKFYTESQYDIYVNDEKYMERNKEAAYEIFFNEYPHGKCFN